MKNLSKIIAAGLIKDEKFETNLAKLIDSVPKVANLLAEGVVCPISEQKIKQIVDRNISDNKIITSVSEPKIQHDLSWQVKVYCIYPVYYASKEFTGGSRYQKSDEYQYEKIVSDSRWITLI